MKILFLIPIYILLFIADSTSKENPKVRNWFDSTEFTDLEITRTKAGSTNPTHLIKINDPVVIKSIVESIKLISPNGDMMKSLLIDETIILSFHLKEKITSIYIYDGRFKTPTTGFNSSAKDKELENKLYTQINQILK